MANKIEDKKEYSVYKCRLKSDNSLFCVFDEWAHLANNLYNETLFVLRQLFTGLKKDEKDITPLEKETIDNVLKIAKSYNKKLVLNKDQRLVNYYFMDFYFKKTKNENYNSSLPKQTAQHVTREACDNFSTWLKALKEYNKNPSKFIGRPKMPKYKKSGGISTFKITNQVVSFNKNKFGYEVKFPKTKHTLTFNKSLHNKRLKEVNVKYEYGSYKITYLFEDIEKSEPVVANGNVVCGIDLGVNNIASIQTSNGDSLLVKGKFIKSKNQWYNKNIAKNMRGQTVGTTKKAKSSKALNRIYEKRALFMEDTMHKISKKIVEWCEEKQVSTIVIGSNEFWKQGINIGNNTQTFVQIPFSTLIKYIEDKATKVGIEVVRIEESYTSKASFLDLDDIPVYKEGDTTEYVFSGKRISRGMYKSSGGFVFNADLNGAGNILRKYTKKSPVFNLSNLAFPEILDTKKIYM